jgi:hypothetical protein
VRRSASEKVVMWKRENDSEVRYGEVVRRCAVAVRTTRRSSLPGHEAARRVTAGF